MTAITLDCRDGVHAACVTCGCECHQPCDTCHGVGDHESWCPDALCHCGQLPQACVCDRGVDRAEGLG